MLDNHSVASANRWCKNLFNVISFELAAAFVVLGIALAVRS